MNSNDPIFKTGLASLNIQNQWPSYKKIFNETQSSSKLLKSKYKEIYKILNSLPFYSVINKNLQKCWKATIPGAGHLPFWSQ